ncbi:MAG: hypothetical protein Q7T26_08155 [Dehalococcoidia bacterium]|nr:hypothetical protein [Dehalococcoidia bacterium]
MLPPTPTPTVTPIPQATRDAVVRFAAALQGLDSDTEMWWRDFDAYMKRESANEGTPLLGDFDSLSGRYDNLLDRLRRIAPPSDPLAREVSIRWVTAYLKMQDFVGALREAVASRRGDLNKIQALDAASNEAGMQADNAMQALVAKFQLKPEEIAPLVPQGQPKP